MSASRFAFGVSVFAALSGLGATGVQASSPQAWEEFRRDVETSCLEAARPHIEAPRIVVDPFGSQSYGLALLRGPSVEDGSWQSMICVYDKATRMVEVGGILALERIGPSDATATPRPAAEPPVPFRPTPHLLSPDPLAPTGEITSPAEVGEVVGASDTTLAGLCDGPCPSALDRLTPDDRNALLDLAGRIERTLAAGEGTALGDASAAAREAARNAAIGAGGEGGDLRPFGPELVGSASCTLFYFGFEGEAARTVGTHRCRIVEGPGGGLRVEKTSGERLSAELAPLRGEVSAFIGRSFEAGAQRQAYDPAAPQDDPASDLGNVVGFAVRTEDGVYLVSPQRRRFDPSDDFFWVLALDRS